MENFDNGYLKIILNQNATKVSMSWIGQSDDREPSVSLSPYLEGLIEKLKEKELHIEYEQLEYMNSSTVMPIIHFMKGLDANGVKTTVTYDSHSDWQRASFKALEAMSCIMKNITVRGK